MNLRPVTSWQGGRELAEVAGEAKSEAKSEAESAVPLASRGENMSYPRMVIDTKKIEHNARVVSELASQYGTRIVGIAKGTCAHPAVVEAMVAGGVKAIGDSRIENLRRVRESGYGGETVLIRAPGYSRCAEAVKYADTSLNSEITTVMRLGEEATRIGKVHKVVLMIDLGDLREGVLPDKAPQVAREMAHLPGIELVGVGVNWGCFGGVIPTKEKMSLLIRSKKQIEDATGLTMSRVSGGSSTNMKMLLDGDMPDGVTELRIGEAILLGLEAVRREHVPGCYQDAFLLQAEVIEVQSKPSQPFGEIGQDAFGNVPVFQDRGIRRRALLAVGRQDIDPDALSPLTRGVEILGASSDHLVCDIEDAEEPISTGDIITFVMTYGALLKASTSPYVKKQTL